MADSSNKERSRACAYCNKSKTKCFWPGEPGAGSCQRCARLNRPCSLPEQGEKRKRGPSARVVQLEEKIDGIMSLLNASQHLQQQVTPPSTGSSPHTHPAAGHQEPVVQNGSYAAEKAYFDIGPSLRVTAEEANRCLDLYRSEYSPHFPFVPVPAGLTAGELHERQPFLLQIIIQIITPQSASVQRAVAYWVRQYIAQHVIVEQEKRLELLQGLLLFLAWGDFHFYVDPRGTNLFQMAAGMTIEWGLNKPVKTPAHVPNQFLDAARNVKGIRGRPPHMLDDMRAFLGVFYTNSQGSSLFFSLPMFDYSNYMTTCRVAIENAAEFTSDSLLSAFIRMQHIVCRMRTMFPNPEADGGEPLEFSGAIHMAMKTFRAELESLRSGLPVEIQSNYMFDICFKGVLVQLYEPAIYTKPSLASSVSPQSAWRSEALWGCLEASKNFMLAYCDIPSNELPYLPCTVTSYFAFAIVSATRLLCLSDSDWNQAVARRTMGFVEITRRLSDHFERADEVAAAEEWRRKNKCVEEGRPITRLTKEKLRWIASWFLARQGGGDEGVPQAAEPSGVSSMSLDTDGIFNSADVVSSEWWEAFAGDLAYNFGPVAGMAQ
ncbi:hypothetical protein QBC47DRAFT_68766 [Echria macrotheca]|uniref:Zn(2)-C6 fungal-type domain-containing protein n=1 Tax=Echria macrotheca TaxID=438768 RepID=A0AAJ0B6R4_9PEZI|nr:hypothetical protein QBC47DRAFT_68766 [Echria macrotheca]